jgi:histidyl-tRNA synthetase
MRNMEPITLNTASFFKRAVNVAEHYGFTNTHSIVAQLETVKDAGSARNNDITATHGHLPHILRQYAKSDARKERRPLLYYTPTIVSDPATPHERLSAFSLSAAGVHDPLTELTLLKATLGVLDEFGVRNVSIRVNSMGDSDSMTRFMREAHTRMKDMLPTLSKEHATAFRANPNQTISQLFAERHSAVDDIAAPINFLTTPSRKYFRDLISLLEYADMPFVLDDRLYGDHTMYAHTLYEIYVREKNGTERLVARGGRYDPLTKKHARSTIPTAGIAIICKSGDPQLATHTPKRARKPHACIVHIGREAHIKSIVLVDAFRKAKLPIAQCLHLSRLSEQMAFAETQHPKYMLIIGQKEALQNVAIVRNTEDQSQATVPLCDVPVYVRGQVRK